MATVRQRNGRWQAIVKRKGHPLLSKTFSLRGDAEKWARQQERLIDTGIWLDYSSASRLLLRDLLERYLHEVTPNKKGNLVEGCRIRLFMRSALADYSLTSLSSSVIASWRDARLKSVSGSTVAKELALLGHVLSVSTKEWGIHLPTNPVRDVRKPPQAAPRNRVLNDSERAKLLTGCKQCKNPWIFPVTAFALATAARRGEILNLSWPDVDLVNKTVKLKGKTGERSIPLSPSALSVLTALATGDDERVFPVSVEALKQAFERAVKRAGIANLTFHDLRHDALTQMAKLGLNILELRAISGHTSANMLQRYVNIDVAELAKKLV